MFDIQTIYAALIVWTAISLYFTVQGIWFMHQNGFLADKSVSYTVFLFFFVILTWWYWKIKATKE